MNGASLKINISQLRRMDKSEKEGFLRGRPKLCQWHGHPQSCPSQVDSLPPAVSSPGLPVTSTDRPLELSSLLSIPATTVTTNIQESLLFLPHLPHPKSIRSSQFLLLHLSDLSLLVHPHSHCLRAVLYPTPYTSSLLLRQPPHCCWRGFSKTQT